MSYIGNTPFTAAFLTDTFSGNGSTVAFTMTVAPANTSSILVSVTGVLQSPDTYSVSGTTLTFSAAPPSGTSNISVRYLGIPASGVTTTAYRTVTNFTATSGQTSFSVPSYTVGYIDVYRNGVRLVSTDYTATTGTTVVLNNACTVGDSVVTESFLVSSVLNAIPATAGAVNSTYLAGGAALANIGSGGVTQTYLGTNVAGNGPAFSAYATATQSISNATTTKIVYDTEDFDTNSNFASNRFTPTVAGYYQINAGLFCAGSAAGGNVFSLYKNGSEYVQFTRTLLSNAFNVFSNGSCLVYCNGSTDYLEIFTTQNSGGTLNMGNGAKSGCWFNGCLVRSA